MRKLFPLLFSLVTLISPVQAQQLPVAPALAAKAWLLLEAGSGQILPAQADVYKRQALSPFAGTA